MNVLKLSNEVSKRFRINYPQYWLDQLMNRVLKTQEGEQGKIVTFGQILAVLRHEESGEELVMPGVNIVTNAGDQYYAEKIVGASLTKNFTAAGSRLRLGSNNAATTKTQIDVQTFLAGTGIALVATYPKVADGDTDNTGAGAKVVTWRYDYTTAQGNATAIIEGAVTDDGTTPTAALTRFLFAAAFDKTSSDTLKVIINHTPTGV